MAENARRNLSLLIADDEPVIRHLFRVGLEREPDFAVVGEAGDGREATELARIHQPDVVLMDISMPKLDGIEATRRIVQASGDVRVIILTNFLSSEHVFAALRAGASGFVLKDSAVSDLADSVRTVASGDALLSPSVTRFLFDSFATRQHEATYVISPWDVLTERELEVLRLIAGGLSNGEIAEKLVVAVTTVRTHVSHILSKLSLRDRVQAVACAYEHGLVRGR